MATAAEKLREVHAIDPSDLMETFFEFVFHAIAANPGEVMARMNRKLDTEQS